MDSYIFFPENGEPSKNIAPYGRKHHIRANMMGPKAGTYDQFPIIVYVKKNSSGEEESYLIAYEVEPDSATIDSAIASLRLSPVIIDKDEDE